MSQTFSWLSGLYIPARSVVYIVLEKQRTLNPPRDFGFSEHSRLVDVGPENLTYLKDAFPKLLPSSEPGLYTQRRWAGR